uniref:Guanylate-binding protein/Atlastin C-terminal domain-containing protein n=1 Tax=Neovison vison TaxID=452646 RepID=A0A8C7BZM1_NEOVI
PLPFTHFTHPPPPSFLQPPVLCIYGPLTFFLKEIKEDFLLQNEDASVKYCQAQLKQLSESLMKSISRGTFCVPGGYHLYLEEKEKVEWDYNQVQRKGVKANEVLQHFLQNQVAVENSILQGDVVLTYQEKALAGTGTKEEAAGKKLELLRWKYKEQQQKLEIQKRSFKENLAQLREKLERESENFQGEQEKTLKHKLTVNLHRAWAVPKGQCCGSSGEGPKLIKTMTPWGIIKTYDSLNASDPCGSC